MRNGNIEISLLKTEENAPLRVFLAMRENKDSIEIVLVDANNKLLDEAPYLVYFEQNAAGKLTMQRAYDPNVNFVECDSDKMIQIKGE